MSAATRTTTELHDPPVPIRAKLAAAWTSFTFLYLYVDHLHLYKPGVARANRTSNLVAAPQEQTR